MSGLVGGAGIRSGIIDVERNDTQVFVTNANTYNQDLDFTTAEIINAVYRLVTPRTGKYMFYCVLRLRNQAEINYAQAKIGLAKDTAGGTSYTFDATTNRLLRENWPGSINNYSEGNTCESATWIVDCTVAGTAWALFCNSNGNAASSTDYQLLADGSGGAEFGCTRLNGL